MSCCATDRPSACARRARETEAGLEALFRRLSPESLHFRFFTIPKSTLVEARALAQPGGRDHFVLVGELGGRLSAVASYHRRPRDETRAEVAFAIADELPGPRRRHAHARSARRRGPRRPDRSVRRVRPQRQRPDDARVPRLRLRGREPAGRGRLPRRVVARPDARVRAAGRRALRGSRDGVDAPLLRARGGRRGRRLRERGSFGSEVFHNVSVEYGYTGSVYPVNPNADPARRRPAPTPRSSTSPGCRPRRCRRPRGGARPGGCRWAREGRQGLVVISAGFRGVRPRGRARERASCVEVREAGIRIVGPNCMGLLNTDPGVS